MGGRARHALVTQHTRVAGKLRASPVRRPGAPGQAATLDDEARPVIRVGAEPRAPPGGQHPEPVDQYLDGDVYRVSAKAENGWTVSVPNALATAKFGGRVDVPVHAQRTGGPIMSKVTLTAVSESNPGRSATATCTVTGR